MPDHHDTRLRRRQDQPGHCKRESIRDLGYEQLPRQRRSLLDSGLSRRTRALRYPTREYEPDHASRIRQACRPLSRATSAKHRRPRSQRLTTVPPYETKAEGSSHARPRRVAPLHCEGGVLAREPRTRFGIRFPLPRLASLPYWTASRSPADPDSAGARKAGSPCQVSRAWRSSFTSQASTDALLPGVSEASIASSARAASLISSSLAKYCSTTAVPC